MGNSNIKQPSAKSQNQKEYIKAIKKYDITLCQGPPGTGKTHLAVGMAMFYLLTQRYGKVIIARPTVEAGEKIGFLPGDIEGKLGPFLTPVLDEMEYCIDNKMLREYLDQKLIEIAPIAFMRGRTFKNAFVICDESQNLSYDQMKMILTRLGDNSKLVLTGDVDQSDLHNRDRGAFHFAYKLLEDDPEVGTIHFTHDDIQRHYLVSKVLEKWENALDKKKNPTKLKPVTYDVTKFPPVDEDW